MEWRGEATTLQLCEHLQLPSSRDSQELHSQLPQLSRCTQRQRGGVRRDSFQSCNCISHHVPASRPLGFVYQLSEVSQRAGFLGLSGPPSRLGLAVTCYLDDPSWAILVLD